MLCRTIIENRMVEVCLPWVSGVINNNEQTKQNKKGSFSQKYVEGDSPVETNEKTKGNIS